MLQNQHGKCIAEDCISQNVRTSGKSRMDKKIQNAHDIGNYQQSSYMDKIRRAVFNEKLFWALPKKIAREWMDALSVDTWPQKELDSLGSWW